jgi:hypothetical protein
MANIAARMLLRRRRGEPSPDFELPGFPPLIVDDVEEDAAAEHIDEDAMIPERVDAPPGVFVAGADEGTEGEALQGQRRGRRGGPVAGADATGTEAEGDALQDEEWQWRDAEWWGEPAAELPPSPPTPVLPDGWSLTAWAEYRRVSEVPLPVPTWARTCSTCQNRTA